jgi:hypothetical protein
MKIYRVITSENGIKELENRISVLLNQGWKLVGGIGFNHGYPYQAVIGQTLKPEDDREIEAENTSVKDKAPRQLGANEAMKLLDDLL